MTLLTFSATVPGLKPACDSNGCHPTSAQTAACFIGLYLIALGTGGIKPCVSAFGADQFDENDDTERLKKSSFFNCFISQLILVHSLLLQRWFGFRWTWVGVGDLEYLLLQWSLQLYFSSFGSKWYRLQPPGGSTITRICQVIVAACRKSGLQVRDNKSLLYETEDAESNITGSRKLVHTN